MTRLLRNGSRILFWLAVLLLVANLYAIVTVGLDFNSSGDDYRFGDKLGLFLRAISSGVILPALAFFGAGVLYHLERWKGRGE